MLLQNRHVAAQRIDRVLEPIIGLRQFFGELLHRGRDLHHLAGQDFKLLILDILPLNLPLQRIYQSGDQTVSAGQKLGREKQRPKHQGGTDNDHR